jgi:hypothetical protein
LKAFIYLYFVGVNFVMPINHWFFSGSRVPSSSLRVFRKLDGIGFSFSLHLSNHENRWFSLLNPKPKHLKLTVIKTLEYPPVHNKYRAPTAILLLLHAPTHPPQGFSFIHFVMDPKW